MTRPIPVGPIPMMMKKQLLLLVAACWLGPLVAQPLIDNSIIPQAGDTLITAIDAFPTNLDLGTVGGPQIWNFRNLQENTTRQRPIADATNRAGADRFPEAQVVIPLTDGADGYYRRTDDRLELIGYLGEDPIDLGLEASVAIDPAYVERRAPLAFGSEFNTSSSLIFPAAATDLAEELLDSIPIPFDSVRVRVRTDRADVIDAFGTLELPSGSFEVLRERRTEYRDLRIDVKLGFLPWTDVTDLVQELLPDLEIGRDTAMSYFFWANGIPQAVASASLNPLTEEILSVEYEYANLLVGTKSPLPTLAAKLYPNPANDWVQLEWPTTTTDIRLLEIYNAQGQLARRIQIKLLSNQPLRVQVGQLPPGLYRLVAQTDEGRFLLTQPLILQ